MAQQYHPAAPIAPVPGEPNPSAPAIPAPPGAPPAADPAAPVFPSDDGGLFSPGFFLQLGFSFIVGLAVGFALKIAFKIALVVGGIILIALFALQYVDLININWTGMEANYDSFVEWLSAYAGGLKNFMANNLSSTASFAGGLLIGLKL